MDGIGWISGRGENNLVKDLHEDEEEKNCDAPSLGRFMAKSGLPEAGHPPRPNPRQDIVGSPGDEDGYTNCLNFLHCSALCLLSSYCGQVTE